MLVKEGDLVDKGQLLLRLDDTASKAKLRRLILREYRLLATAARLKAEINGTDKMEMPPAVMAASSDPEVQAIVKGQEDALAANKASLADQEEVYRKEIAGLNESIQGYQAQATSNRSRLSLIGTLAMS